MSLYYVIMVMLQVARLSTERYSDVAASESIYLTVNMTILEAPDVAQVGKWFWLLDWSRLVSPA